MDYLKENYPYTELNASGKAVGLPEGYQGNSEVGHLTIGAGRIVKQSELRVSEAIEKGSFQKNKKILDAIEKCGRQNKTFHLMGLMSDKGVHSHIEHAKAILKMAKDNGLSDVLLHFFTDGRDSPPKSGKRYLKELKEFMDKLGVGRVVTVCGRFYSMDRDKRWQRTKKAYQAIVNGKGNKVGTAEEAINESYKSGKTDEFIVPTVIGDYKGIDDGDCVFFFNFRFDRARQITHAMIDKKFDGFKLRQPKVNFIAMTEYYKGIQANVIFPLPDIQNHLGSVLSQNGFRQLRISETEKYAHVTFFFNGLIEKPWKKEYRIVVPSPKVKTYDQKPEMSVHKITDNLVSEMKGYDVVISNLVNGDLVGHTGDIKAARKAVEAVDKSVKRIYEKVRELGGEMIIIADHGNCEEMIAPVKTSHTTNKVPFIYVGKGKLKEGQFGLSNVSPTILKVLKIKKPKEMDKPII